MRSWIIGSEPGCDLVVVNGNVSGQHCRLTFAAGNFQLEDLGSTNGTWVNGQRITAPVRVLQLINGEHYSGAERVQDLLALKLAEFGFETGFVCLKPGRFAAMRESQLEWLAVRFTMLRAAGSAGVSPAKRAVSTLKGYIFIQA